MRILQIGQNPSSNIFKKVPIYTSVASVFIELQNLFSSENGRTSWARYVLKSMQWSKRKSATGKIESSELFLLEEKLTFQRILLSIWTRHLCHTFHLGNTPSTQLVQNSANKRNWVSDHSNICRQYDWWVSINSSYLWRENKQMSSKFRISYNYQCNIFG